MECNPTLRKIEIDFYWRLASAILSRSLSNAAAVQGQPSVVPLLYLRLNQVQIHLWATLCLFLIFILDRTMTNDYWGSDLPDPPNHSSLPAFWHAVHWMLMLLPASSWPAGCQLHVVCSDCTKSGTVGPASTAPGTDFCCLLYKKNKYKNISSQFDLLRPLLRKLTFLQESG